MPESSLIIQDFGGRLSADMEGTRARLMKGGSWKRQRIITIIPADSMIPAKVYLSHLNLIYPPNNGVVRILAQGMEVGEAYSKAIESILAHPDLKNWEYVLSVEHDNTPPQDGVLKLIETLEQHPEFAAASGAYYTKGVGGCFQAWGDPNDPILNFRPRIPQASGLLECCGLGMGFCLFRLSMFKDERLRRPWFVTQKGLGGCATQDLYAWGDFRKWGYRAVVNCDVKVGHYEMATDTVW